ncbi:MAG TPA: potassium channel family protein [Actinomycetes bacterium]|nr:potassium channel family protein [Actinomycetes bacterium]
MTTSGSKRSDGLRLGSGVVKLPEKPPSPLRQVLSRVGIAVLVAFAVGFLVWLDRDGYRDVNDDGVSLLDAVYYSTVSLTTTGYGDITPSSDAARLFNIYFITPLRIIFLVALVGTTLEVLTERSRREFRENRWRQTLLAHTVIVGFGVKGRAAARTLLDSGTTLDKIVVIDGDPVSIEEANEMGFAAVLGNATRSEVLRRAHVGRAKSVIVAPDDDATAVLVTLTARRLNGTAHIVVSVREAENVPLVNQSGADAVVTSAEAAGRMLGLSAEKPEVGRVVEDLLITGEGLDIEERSVSREEIGLATADVPALVLAVVRDGYVRRYDDGTLGGLRSGDRVITVRSVRGKEDLSDPSR